MKYGANQYDIGSGLRERRETNRKDRIRSTQWYLIVSTCLIFNEAMVALMILALTQSAIAIWQTSWVFWAAMHLERGKSTSEVAVEWSAACTCRVSIKT